MKKRLLRRHSNALLPQGIGVIPLVLLALVMVAVLLRLLVPNFFITLTAPLWRISAFAASATYDASATIKNPVALQHALDAANEEVTTLTTQNTTLAGQVQDLQKLLGDRVSPPRGILASVLMRPPESSYDTLVIDQGASAGVVADAPVTGPGGAPVGKVVSVTTSTARVLMYSQPGVATQAWAGQGRVPITLTGAGGGAFDASVPKDAKISPGDPVYVGGVQAIGTVSRIDTDPSSPLATLRIVPFISPFTLTWVIVSHTP